MESIRKWFCRPKRDDKSLLAQFFYADEALNIIANELDSFDGRKDPGRCTTLVNQLRQSQDKVLTITNAIMDHLIGDERANRDFRVKFPEDVLQENLAGQLWFGAECLAAGSSIMNREAESTAMRPLAKAVTKSLENVRNLLRETCLNNNTPNGPIKLDSNENEFLLESLKIFDKLFAEFELAYVSAMVPVKTTQEYELQELISVLFSETLQRALKMKLLTQEMIDDCDPALMFTIPRLAIVSGLLIYPSGPLCIDKTIDEMSNMFRPFRTLLIKIRQLLWTLNKRELYMLEKILCDNEQISDFKSVSDIIHSDDFIDQFYDFSNIKDYFITSTTNGNDVKNQCKSSSSSSSSASSTTSSSSSTSSVDIPSTSGYLIPKGIVDGIIVAYSVTNTPERNSPSDNDSLEVISEAAANLSSLLTEDEVNKNDCNDSGISTENTSLDRSPSLELDGNCNKNSPSTSTNRQPPKPPLSARKQNTKQHQTTKDEDCSSVGSSDTSSFISNDDEEIALAMQAAELANKNEIRSKYRSSEDLIHRLFVCIAGVADQLQTNFASDLRNILKAVFLMNTSSNETSNNNNNNSNLDNATLEASLEYRPSENDVIEHNEFSVDPNILAQEALFDTNVYFHLDNQENIDDYSNHPRPNNNHQDDDGLATLSRDLSNLASLRDDNPQPTTPPPLTQSPQPPLQQDSTSRFSIREQPPIWIPDVEAPKCMSCGVNFTVVKRRHHCRNCGKVFCARCSSNSVPLPKFGHNKPVRVCNRCFIYNPFTM